MKTKIDLNFPNREKENELKSKYNTNTEWLKSLNIKINVNKINKQNFDRTIQLFNKTNQMNLTTRRKNEDQLKYEIKQKNNLFLHFLLVIVLVIMDLQEFQV